MAKPVRRARKPTQRAKHPKTIRRTRELLTVREVARIARVSERTVRLDIADGRLPAIRSPGRRVHVPRSALADYRAAAHAEQLLTVRQVADLIGQSVRTVRRRIRDGALVVVRVSPRCIRIHACSVLHRSSIDGRPISLAELQARHQVTSIVQGVEQDVVAGRVESLVCLINDCWVSVRWIAQVSGRSNRRVYHDVKKDALPSATSFSRRLLRVQLRDVLAYVDDATALVTWMVKCVCRGADDVAAQAEISRRFKAYLADPQEMHFRGHIAEQAEFHRRCAEQAELHRRFTSGAASFLLQNGDSSE